MVPVKDVTVSHVNSFKDQFHMSMGENQMRIPITLCMVLTQVLGSLGLRPKQSHIDENSDSKVDTPMLKEQIFYSNYSVRNSKETQDLQG